MDKPIKAISKTTLFIQDLEKPQPAHEKVTTEAVGEECGKA